jgi:hypothetical protein
MLPRIGGFNAFDAESPMISPRFMVTIVSSQTETTASEIADFVCPRF